MKKTTDWSLSDVWNMAFENVQDDPIKKRDYLYASELGTSFIEVYYKLKGTPYTNTFTVANRRKMEAGKLCEGIVRFVLMRAGILKKSQQDARFQLKGQLPVHGRLDYVAGGDVDLKQAEGCTEVIKIMFDELAFPKIYLQVADNALEMVKSLAGKKNHSLSLYVYELKSVSDFVFRLIEASPRPLNDHHQQLYHYLLSLDMAVGKIGYLSREDVRLFEKKVVKNDEIHREYVDWITAMTDYTKSATPPPKDPLIIFHSGTCKFNKNTRMVEWCKYLTMIYGFANADEFRQHIEPIVKSYNYVYDRCVNCQKLTAENQSRIAEIKGLFPDFDNLVDLGKLRIVKKEAVA